MGKRIYYILAHSVLLIALFEASLFLTTDVLWSFLPPFIGGLILLYKRGKTLQYMYNFEQTRELHPLYIWILILQLLILFITFFPLFAITSGRSPIDRFMIIWSILNLFIIVALAWTQWYISKKYLQLKESYKVVCDEREKMLATFQEIRAQRHDFLTHINGIHFLLNQGKWNEGREYLNHLTQEYESTNLSIKGEQGHIAAILYQNYQRAKNLGIEVDYQFDVPLSFLPLSSTDQSRLISNLLSNAVEAAEEYNKECSSITKNKKHKAIITLASGIRSGLYLLQITNSTPPIPRELLDKLFLEPGKTTKNEAHEGLGTFIIGKIVKESSGLLDFTYHRDRFQVKIKLPIIE